jgi:hypothetical protein
MPLFRSRSKDAKIAEGRISSAAAPARFQVEEAVRLTDHFSVYPVASTGVVKSVNPGSGLPSYDVEFGHGSPIEIPEQFLDRIPSVVPGFFEVGARVRLAEDFDGIMVDEGLAAEEPDTESQSEHVGLKAGATVGTVMLRKDGRSEVIVKLDWSSMALFIDSRKLERIPGCTRVTVDDDGSVHIRLFFAYLDAVVLTEDAIMFDGYPLKQGTVGYIRPMSVHMPVVQEMQESWRTGIYNVYFNCADGEPRWQNIHSNLLRLESDLPTVTK